MRKVDIVAIVPVTILISVAGASEGPPRADAQLMSHRTPDTDLNVTCLLKHNCTLPCPFEGEFKEGSWKREDEPFGPIVVQPPPLIVPRPPLYGDIASLAVQQPGGGAMLVISDTQIRHEGLHQCKVTTKDGQVFNYFVNVQVRVPVWNVSVHQEGQQLFCHSEGIHPEPNLTWTPLSDSEEPRTSVNFTDGLYSIWSSLSVPASGAAQTYTCNVSTPYSWSTATVTLQNAAPDNSDLKYLWILVVLIPVAALVFFLIHYRQKLSQVSKLSKKDPPTSDREGPDSKTPLRSSGTHQQENGHPNGVIKVTPV